MPRGPHMLRASICQRQEVINLSVGNLRQIMYIYIYQNGGLEKVHSIEFLVFMIRFGRGVDVCFKNTLIFSRICLGKTQNIKIHLEGSVFKWLGWGQRDWTYRSLFVDGSKDRFEMLITWIQKPQIKRLWKQYEKSGCEAHNLLC